jgi:RNA polymerase sigma factor (sigma-70 family)
MSRRHRSKELDPDEKLRFELLYKACADRVLRYALRRASWEDAQDVVAETFTTAWRRLDDIPDDALPWLFRVARNHLSNQQRTVRRRGALSIKLHAEFGSRPTYSDSGELGDAPDRELVAAIHALPEREREAFMLVAWDGLDNERAARALGCSSTTFRVRLHRARRRLRKALGPTEGSTAQDPAPVTDTRMEKVRWIGEEIR